MTSHLPAVLRGTRLVASRQGSRLHLRPTLARAHSTWTDGEPVAQPTATRPGEERLALQAFCAGGRPFLPPARPSWQEMARTLAQHQEHLAQAQEAMAQYEGLYEDLFATSLQAQAHAGRWSAGHRDSFLQAFVAPAPPTTIPPPVLGQEWVKATENANLSPVQVQRQAEWANLPVPVLLARILGEREAPAPIEGSLDCISILKRRRKKMNKHKWRKRRRAVRNSTRYNKERKSGESRIKME